jgi:hypothetical protein
MTKAFILILLAALPAWGFCQNATAPIDTMSQEALVQVYQEQFEQKKQNTTVILFLLNQHLSETTKLDTLLNKKWAYRRKVKALSEEREKLLPILNLQIANLQIERNMAAIEQRIKKKK